MFIADNWEALFRTMALSHEVAMEVGEGWSYTYPLGFDQRVTAYVKDMQRRFDKKKVITY